MYDTAETYLKFPDLPNALATKDLTVKYDETLALQPCSAVFPKNRITALIGPSGSGKSTFLRCLNRMNDEVAAIGGQIMLDGININDPKLNVYQLRQQVGMLFQQPNPFARSIRFNLSFGVLEHQKISASDLHQRMEQVLSMVDLWTELDGDLERNALQLSGGQQQRLCLARTLMSMPQVLLLDEPASALDPISTAKIEANLLELKQNYTIIIVTHNLEQAARISDYTAFFYDGHLMEYDATAQLFIKPHLAMTDDYLSGNFG